MFQNSDAINVLLGRVLNTHDDPSLIWLQVMQWRWCAVTGTKTLRVLRVGLTVTGPRHSECSGLTVTGTKTECSGLPVTGPKHSECSGLPEWQHLWRLGCFFLEWHRGVVSPFLGQVGVVRHVLCLF